MDNPEKRATPGTQTQDDDKQSKNTAQYYVGQQYGQATTNKVNKTWEVTGDKDEPEIVTDITTRNSERNDT